VRFDKNTWPDAENAMKLRQKSKVGKQESSKEGN
jgi:hypothetical protein